MKKRYYVKHEEWYANGDDPGLWHKYRNQVSESFDTFVDAKTWADTIKRGPRQFAGLGSKARVVSVKLRKKRKKRG